MVDTKQSLEEAIFATGFPYLCWIYAYLQNRNQWLTLHLESRMGKVHHKKETAKAAEIMIRLITGLLQPKQPDELVAKVTEHLRQLYDAKRFDTILGQEVFVKDYPEKEKPESENPPALESEETAD